MMTKLSIPELFQIAESMETDAQQFYTLAAAKSTDQRLKKIFSELSDWETQHIQTFQNLAASVQTDSSADVADPASEIDEYLHAIVKGAVFDLGDSIEDAIGNISTPMELLKYACEMEKKAVLFYMGLRQALPTSSQDAITPIVDEETRHIVYINRLIMELND